mgnify:CR=1 FL=1
MRLKQVKLAGFKSFCDPTTFELPSQLVGIVGPNGCGKSNIIDATRWVLGESRATELRGESMQDVIFNGSLERKPSSRASVELVFDNSLGRIGGAWGGFAEISVKRVLTREGQSTYYINQQAVRRKDVHDIFLGTGLGPRAYAIIGQGTISRIIEAKPDELRVFFEEAAGVSKYKERRRETENRLADTRENLTRVEDILRELHGQISKLDAQAEVAGRYRAMEAERTQKQQWLWLIKRDDAQAEQQLLEKTAESLDLEIEGLQTGLRSAENRMETLREAVHQANDEVSRCQAAYYEVNSEISTLESQIRMIAQNRNQAQARLKSLEEQIQSARALSEGGGSNVVNVMLVDFRGYDTMGEITVLSAVALAVYALLRRFRPPRESTRLPSQQRLPPDIVTDLVNPKAAADTALGYMMVPAVLVRLLQPLALVVAIYLLMRGHNQPGGGFIAGLVVSIGFILQYMVAGTQWVESHMKLRPPRWIAYGLLTAIGCGLCAWLFGYPFLTTHTGHLNLPIFGETHLPSAAVFDLGVFAVVVGGTMLILTALSHQSIRRTRRPIAGEEGEAGLPEGDAGHRGTGDDTLTSS